MPQHGGGAGTSRSCGEGDRFASRIDVEAAWERGIVTVDTTNGSSYPVSEWALALIMVSLRNAGHHFRRILAGDYSPSPHDDFGYHPSVCRSGNRGGLWTGRSSAVEHALVHGCRAFRLQARARPAQRRARAPRP